ncbi:response regulator transcription factor [Chloroflexota bacterium]
MDEAEDTKQLDVKIESLADQEARNKANVAQWSLNIAIFLFGLLIIIIILVSMEFDPAIVAILAILGLITVWLVGWRRGKQLYQRFYTAELLNLKQKYDEDATDLVQLTRREIQILTYAAQGYANKRIAYELDISENTIKHFVSSILNKLNANDRTEAVVIAIKNKLITIS